MYNLEDFEPYFLRKSLGQEVVLAWNRKNGYHFLSFLARMKAMGEGEYIKIIAVEKR
jgi:hypothetical protein